MAREIVSWCDPHLADEDVKLPGSAVTVTIDKRGPVELDLCDDCRSSFLTPIEKLMADYGRRSVTSGETEPAELTTAQRSARRRIECPLGCGQTLARSSFPGHFRTKHGREIADVEDELGHALDGSPLDHVCPECDRGFTRPQSLGIHRYQAHGVEGTSSSAKGSTTPEPPPVPTKSTTPRRRRSTKSTSTRTRS